MVKAQFDVYRLPDQTLVVDVQSPVASVHGTRLVIPLIEASDTTLPIARLNPQFSVQGRTWVLGTHFATTIDAKALHQVVDSLAREEWAIKGALDFLVNGF